MSRIESEREREGGRKTQGLFVARSRCQGHDSVLLWLVAIHGLAILDCTRHSSSSSFFAFSKEDEQRMRIACAAAV